jgi:hypothetical protein
MNAGASTIFAAAPRPRRVFRPPLGPRLFSLFGVIFLAAATGLMIGFGGLIFLKMGGLMGLFAMACAGFMGALTGYCWRDLRGKWHLRVILDTDAAVLDLPRGRSLIHRPPAQRLTIPYSDIQGIDSRFEAYGSLGMECMQRAYVLHRRNGDLIFLFEERALATRMESTYYADIVTDLAARAGVKLRDLGTVEGKGGLLATWGAHAPDWTAPALPHKQAVRLWQHAASTG